MSDGPKYEAEERRRVRRAEMTLAFLALPFDPDAFGSRGDAQRVVPEKRDVPEPCAPDPEYPDAIATLTAERDALRAEVAALKAASAAGDVLPPIDEELRLYRERVRRCCSLCERPIAPEVPRWVGLWSESEDVSSHIGRYHRVCRVFTDVKGWESWHKGMLDDLDDADVEDVRREIPDELREEWVELCLAQHWIP